MLATLSSQINAEHAEAERSLRASVEHAIRAGELLLQAKCEIGHGNWTGWLQENITFSDRLAQAYMRLARLPAEKRNAVAVAIARGSLRNPSRAKQPRCGRQNKPASAGGIRSSCPSRR
jgi:hypothetical protein